MCRMVVAPMGVPGRLLIDGFLRMSQGLNALNEINTELGKINHGDGWGAVCKPNGEAVAHRSVRACWEDAGIGDLRDRTLFLLHARRASKGSVTLDNVHPFQAEVAGARWFFCHNGTVRDELPIAETLTKVDPTDSEKVFHLLLPFIDAGNILAGIREIYGAIRDYTCLNSFLLGPDDLWAVCLHIENPRYYALTLTEMASGPIVSSEPLPELGDSSVIPSRTILHIDRRTGTIESHTLG
ncbi:class II glutamine amidotransferase [Candidatus Bipolaricaulota bacterium]|nr:class II glutamine amidotransferase [Candidatus Bipolaricaulota bacterium]